MMAVQIDPAMEAALEAVRRLVAEAGSLDEFAPRPPRLRLVGKQIRARLMLTTAFGLGALNDDAICLAAAVEMIHNASLLHDDVIDGAQTRRGQPCLHVEHGKRVAIMAGDLCFARGMDLICRVDRSPVYHAVNHAVVDLAAGQLADSLQSVDAPWDLDRYLSVVDRKTGALIALCMEAPGILADLPAAQRAALRQAGLLLGRAFQAADDMLDLAVDAGATGKDTHRDLEEGKLTFPYLKLLELGDAGQRATLLNAFRGNGSGRAQVAALAKQLRLHEVFDAQQRSWLDGIDRELASVPVWADKSVFWELCRRFAFRDG